MNCIYCNENCIKRGKSGLVQRYQCKSCKKSQQAVYLKPRIPQEKYEWNEKERNPPQIQQKSFGSCSLCVRYFFGSRSVLVRYSFAPCSLNQCLIPKKLSLWAH